MKIKPIGKKVIINIKNIITGETILLSKIPKLFQILFGIINIFENLNEVNNSITDKVNDHIFKLEPNKRGYKEIKRKITDTYKNAKIKHR